MPSLHAAMGLVRTIAAAGTASSGAGDGGVGDEAVKAWERRASFRCGLMRNG